MASKKKIRSQVSEILNEISHNVFNRAMDVAKERGMEIRAYNMGKTYFRKFIGKPLFGGEIIEIGVSAPKHSNIKLVVITYQVTNEYGSSSTHSLLYDITKDEYKYNFEMNPIERRDAVILSKIAKMINPETKYASPTANFRIKGY